MLVQHRDGFVAVCRRQLASSRRALSPIALPHFDFLSPAPPLAQMAPKRNISAANVTSKRSKVSRELETLENKEDDLKFQKDLDKVVAALKKDHSKMKKVLLVLAMDTVDKFDRTLYFPSDLANRSVTRVPQKFLTDSFFPMLGGPSTPLMKALCKADPKAAHKILCRLCVVSLGDPIGPLLKEAWLQTYKKRVEDMGSRFEDIQWDSNFVINWSLCGHWTLKPDMPANCPDPRQHKYETINFRGVSINLAESTGGLDVRGHWFVSVNYDHRAACLHNPDKSFIIIPCFTLLTKERMALLAPPATLAIEDGMVEARDDDDDRHDDGADCGKSNDDSSTAPAASDGVMPSPARADAGTPASKATALALASDAESPAPKAISVAAAASVGGVRPPPPAAKANKASQAEVAAMLAARAGGADM